MSTDPLAGNASAKAEPRPGGSPPASACEPYREIIEAALVQGRNAAAIYQDLVDLRDFPARATGSYRFAMAASRS